MAQHYVSLAIPKKHKYDLLAEAARLCHTIRFSVMYYATSTTAAALEEEIGAKEGEFIRARRPPLNY